MGAARRLLDRVGVDAHAPVGLLALARDVGITGVQYIPHGPNGVLVPHESGYTIGVNARDVPNRQRFTIAHEIAHRLVSQLFLTGTERIEARQTSFIESQSSNDYTERLCDIAASELLLPECLLQKDDLVDAGPSLVALREIARSYQVSPKTAGIRLIEDGWWDAVLTHWNRQVGPEREKNRIWAAWSAYPETMQWLVPKNRSLPSDSVLQKALMSTAIGKTWRGVERWGRGRLSGWYRVEAEYRTGGDKVLESLLTPLPSIPKGTKQLPLPRSRRNGGTN